MRPIDDEPVVARTGVSGLHSRIWRELQKHGSHRRGGDCHRLQLWVAWLRVWGQRSRVVFSLSGVRRGAGLAGERVVRARV